MVHFFIVENLDGAGLHPLVGGSGRYRTLSSNSHTVRCHHVKYIDPKQTKADLFSDCLITLENHPPTPIISQASHVGR